MKIFYRLSKRFSKFSKPNFEKLESKRDVLRLIKLLEHEEPEIRLKAAEALGKIADVQAVEALIKALFDNNKNVGIAASKSLIDIGVPALKHLMSANRVFYEPIRPLIEKLTISSPEASIDLLQDQKVGRTAAIMLRSIFKGTKNPLVCSGFISALCNAVTIKPEKYRIDVIVDGLNQVDPKWANSNAATKALPTLINGVDLSLGPPVSPFAVTTFG